MAGLLNKVALVTGAARGTGRVHCERFADAGADIIALDVVGAAADLADVADAVKQRIARFMAAGFHTLTPAAGAASAAKAPAAKAATTAAPRAGKPAAAKPAPAKAATPKPAAAKKKARA